MSSGNCAQQHKAAGSTALNVEDGGRKPRAIRCSDAEWMRYQRAALAEGLELSPWARRHLDAAVLRGAGGVAPPTG